MSDGGHMRCGAANPQTRGTRESGDMRVLTINGGSSSVRFALYRAAGGLEKIASGKVERIGLPDAAFTAQGEDGRAEKIAIGAGGFDAAAAALVKWLEGHGGKNVAAVGHRIVHGGMRFADPVRVTAEMIAELRKNIPLDPDHLPSEIQLLEIFARHYPGVQQWACFDTAFHREMPRVAQMIAVPRKLEALGVRRYGFHGLSYTFLLGELQRVAPMEASGKVVFAHLGNGASMAAVMAGKPIDTTMGFTPASGLPMGTRCGDIDPGLPRFLASKERMTAEAFDSMMNHEAGLLGISETSSDMRDLLKREGTDVRAAEAVTLFCYECKKRIGALAAAMGGLDCLVFSGGIGENCVPVRTRICEGLRFLGIAVDEGRNAESAAVISADGLPVVVRVIKTDEERVIADAVRGKMPLS